MKTMIAFIGGSGLLFGLFGLWIFDRIPERWLLDYGEREEDVNLNFAAPRLHLWPRGLGMALLLAAGWAGFYHFHGADKGYFLIGLAILWLLMQIAMADGIYGILPDQFVAGLMGEALLVRGWNLYEKGVCGEILLATLKESSLGAFVCGGGFLCLGWLTARMAGQQTIGMGDCKLLGALGILFGPWEGISVIALALLLCGMVFSVMVVFGRLQLTAHAPFGPYLALTCGLWLIFQ